MSSFEEVARCRVLNLADEQKNKLIKFLQEYIQHKSVNPVWDPKGDEKECQRWLRDQFYDWDSFDKVDFWETEEDRPNLVGVVKGSEDGRGIMFNGHSDVAPVPESSLEKWTVDPWSGEVREGRVYGRGATDMKGPNAAMIWAAKLLHDAGIRLKGDVYIALNIGEESGQHEIGSDSIVDRGYLPSFIINCEATNLEIHPVTVGLLYFKIIVRGKPVHISQRRRCIYPQPPDIVPPGVGAIEKMALYLNAFSELERQWGIRKRHPFMPPGSSNITPTLINGGEFIGSLSGRCEVVYGVWFYPDERLEDVIEEIRHFVDNIAENDDWLREHRPELEIPYKKFPPILPNNLSQEHIGCRTLAKSFREALKREPIWSGFTAVSDLNWMNLKGATGVIFGPGELSMGVHGEDEYTPIKDLVEACKVYACMMINWCGVSEI